MPGQRGRSRVCGLAAIRASPTGRVARRVAPHPCVCWQGPLPGGYNMKEMLNYIGASQTTSNGDKWEYGQQGEVMGPATHEDLKGKGLDMKFPGNKGNIECFLSGLSREPPVRSWGGWCALWRAAARLRRGMIGVGVC